jgi:hypothetical protein
MNFIRHLIQATKTHLFICTTIRNFFPHSVVGSGDDDMRILKQAEIIVADNNLLGMQLYNLPDAKWVQGTWAGVDALMQHYDGSKVCRFLTQRSKQS